MLLSISALFTFLMPIVLVLLYSDAGTSIQSCLSTSLCAYNRHPSPFLAAFRSWLVCSAWRLQHETARHDAAGSRRTVVWRIAFDIAGLRLCIGKRSREKSESAVSLATSMVSTAVIGFELKQRCYEEFAVRTVKWTIVTKQHAVRSRTAYAWARPRAADTHHRSRDDSLCSFHIHVGTMIITKNPCSVPI